MRRAIAGIVVGLTAALAISGSAYAPTVPSGLSAYATSARVALAWQPATGASGYRVYRGTSPSTITTLVSGTITATTFTNASLTNNTTYYYAVRAVYSGVETSASQPVAATPRAATCTGANAIATENCLPGGTGWKISPPADVQNGGIEGFATATSVNAGASVDLKVNTAAGVPYRVEVWRTGWYNGTQGRLVGTLEGLAGVQQQGCAKDAATGLVDCSGWLTTSTLTTTTAWVSGVYLLRLVRADTGGENHILLTVRQDGAARDALFSVPVSTYAAYNDWGGKSLYDWNSNGANTVAGTPRAVKVSYDRPESVNRDWYTNTDIQQVSWLERNGYNVGYVTSVDLHAGVPGLTSRRALIFGQHEEYWTSQMRNAAKAARDARVGLVWTGANAVYWKVRHEASPVSGAGNRVVVCYKSTQSGGPDPSGDPTGTWRDPAGANSPENALLGVQYIGDKDNGAFPLIVDSAQGKHRIWRYTVLATLPSGTSTQVGDTLVGWEWDARANNGLEPAGLSTIAQSPVNGSILQDAGKVYAPGSANQQSTYYRAPSGAAVFATGTMYWSRGLAANMAGVSEPSSAIQQATANALQDMSTRPTTPANITLDATGNAVVSGRTPAVNATAVLPTSNVTATFDRVLDPSTVTGAGFTLTPTGGSVVAASVSYDQASKTVTLDPTQSLAANTTYTARITNAIKGWNGLGVASAVQWSFTTTGGGAPVVSSTLPAAGATGVLTSGDVRATFDRALTASTVTTSSFTLTPAGGSAVAGTVTYDSATRTARLKPTQALALSTQYTARLTTAIKSSDGTPMAADVTWTFTTQATGCPCNLMTGLTPAGTGLPVSDGRSGSNLTYEMGTEFTVDADMALSAIRYYKSPGETGTHIGRLWSSTGTQLGSVAFSGETASGWQQATLSSPVSLTAGQTYVVSVGLNSMFVWTEFGLQSQLTSGPLRSVADGTNGVYGNAAGTFPTNSYHSANYFVDPVVRDPSQAAAPPQVTARTPASGATSVSRTTAVTATFDMAMDATTITGSSFTLKTTSGGTSVAASVSYDAASRTATLTPASQLAASTSYTATLTTAITSSEGVAMSAASTWSFTTAASSAPTVTSTSPPAGTTDVSPLSAVTATFSGSMTAATINGSTFTVTVQSGPIGGPLGGTPVSGTVTYDDATRTARFVPSAALAASTTYSASLSTGVRSSDDVALASAVTWTFTTSACPCQLFGASTTPATTNLPTSDGRAGAGPFSYEMGVKLQVTESARLEAIRFYKSPGETGTHVGRLWSATGTQLASVTFGAETASGWQQANLSSPVALTAGQTYVVSVGINAFFVMTGAGLQSQIVNGPLWSVADGANGVFGSAAGVFPSGSYNNSNYFVDAVVR